MSADSDVSEFGRMYRDYVRDTIAPVRERAMEILREWRSDSFWELQNEGRPPRAIPTPVQRTYGRIKRAESILDKLSKEVSAVERGDLLAMHDIYGARLVVYVESHLPLIDSVIRTSGAFVLHPEVLPKWYLPEALQDRLGLDPNNFQGVSRKKSGYASVHYVLRPADIETDAWFELQVRTMLFDAWGELEHKMIYKPSVSPEFNMTQHLRILADQLMALEEHFDLLYSRITYLQNTVTPQADDILDDTTLPAICHRLELSITQKSVSKLLQILYVQGIITVSDLDQRLTVEGLTVMRAYMSGRGETLTAFHAISVAARVGVGATDHELRETLAEQLELVEASDVREIGRK